MTIGNPNPTEDQPDFKVCREIISYDKLIVLQLLKELREKVCSSLGLAIDEVELSMGMSSDYKIAVCILVSCLG